MKNKLEINAERLLLRRVCQEDAENIFKYRSDAVTNQYQGWIPKTLDDAHNFISKVAETIDEYNTWFQLGIINKENGELIGDLGIHFFDIDKFQVEIGCTIEKKYQGKGFASEALNAIIKYLFTDLNKRRIICSIDPRNVNSIKMVEGLGFRKEAHFKQSILIDGEWFDDVVYSLLKDEWNY
ncbi:N-acetyltransferase [Ancylomarina euxinus]|uniref:N-acetyltransferase n=1 Tax=Ancylomarina euxinus TaxID=2283627 RepID=A0A425Y013_9BACT|nr:GNAT family protein [Ancylomarina euxinus]MCZ4695417.1 GNAT family protein [Ancylomarina euxinus]MUP15613.1 GNAT family N-acetyltransferase [Ancylomarina euxinus]RRG20947.1 N-acetyltransferase [Ancylomarina euxinus]